MVRIAISAAAFEAIAATLPIGSVEFEAKLNAKGEREIWHDEGLNVRGWIERISSRGHSGEGRMSQLFSGEPNQSTQELLDIIKGEAVRGANNGNLNYLMPAFTALLVKLSEAADRRANVVMWLTVILTVLTILIAALTGALVWDAFERHMN